MLPLRSSRSAANAQTFDHKSRTVQGTSAKLLEALKSFAHAKQLNILVSVGNVRKLSVINTLTGCQGGLLTICPTGAKAAVTSSVREVKLDKKLKVVAQRTTRHTSFS